MKVSIVINTYNRADQLKECLRSLWNLQYDEFEVIVVNGPSTDKTKELCAEYSGCLTYIECEERNLSISRNIGIANATGEIVAFIDDDALVEANWLKNIVKYYTSDDIFGVGGFTIDHTGKKFQATTTLCDRLGDSYQVPSGISPTLFQFKDSNLYPSLLGTNSSFRLSALKKIGGFDETFAYFLDETDVCLRLIDLGGKIIYSPEALIFHRYAPSHLRNHNKVPTTLFVQSRSKIYFMLRHGVAALGAEYIDNAILKYKNDLKRDNQWLSNHGYLSKASEALLNLDVERGISDGRRLVQLPVPTNLAKHIQASNRKFKRFANPHKDTLRIALVSQGFPPGDTSGIARWTHHVAHGLALRGHDVHVITRAKNAETIDYKDGVWIHSVLPGESREFEEIFAQLDVPADIAQWSCAAYEEIRRVGFENLDLISAPIWDVEGLISQLFAPIPVITSLHTTYKLALPYKPDWQRPLYKLNHVDKVIAAEKFMFKNSRYLLGNTYAVVSEIENEYSVQIKDRCVVVPHGVDPAEYKGIGSTPSMSTNKILFVGRQESRKGFDTAIEAAAMLCLENSDITFRFIGGQTNDKKCISAISKYHSILPENLRNRITIEGYVSDADLHDAYRECTVFIAPSRFESFGLIAIEAMRYGKAVVAGRVGGLIEVVEDGITGLLINPDDPKDIFKALSILIDDENLRKSMGEAALNKYKDFFTIDTMIDGIEEAYSIFLDRNKSVGLKKSTKSSSKKLIEKKP